MGARGFCFILDIMKEVQPFKYLGELTNIARLQAMVDGFSELDWNTYKERKYMNGVAGGVTETIPLIYDPKQRINANTQHSWFHDFEPYINDVISVSKLHLGDISVKQAMFTRLKPGINIKTHKDKGPLTAKTHRIHVPIKTSDRCVFTVDNMSMSLPAGQIWLIDNVDRYHGVSNNGDESRIHLIIDAI